MHTQNDVMVAFDGQIDIFLVIFPQNVGANFSLKQSEGWKEYFWLVLESEFESR